MSAPVPVFISVGRKITKDAFRTRRRFLDGNAHGNPTDFRPAVRQVIHDGADSRTLIRIVLPADDTSPEAKLAGHRALGRQSRTLYAQPLPPRLRAAGEGAI